ncbi:helix-turn-helix domain-containing protein [Dongshaea marina]|uniref:helix-turn-helix domain-containing protein n=1 Tax=Dongshaea marina TaxID=2047966 RepID=UPI000D3E3362|nr:helix-turn-helix transcriptional regulator [Dongshaea marina]
MLKKSKPLKITLLRRLRQNKFPSAAAFARHIGANRRTVSAHEAGDREIDPTTAQIYARGLGFSDWKQLVSAESKRLDVIMDTYPLETDLLIFITMAINLVSQGLSLEQRRLIIQELSKNKNIVQQFSADTLDLEKLKADIKEIMICTDLTKT